MNPINPILPKIIIGKYRANCNFGEKPFSNFKKHLWVYGTLTLLILATTLIAYKPTLFNFLFMDDFGFLIWLKEAIHKPSLLIKAFAHHYMNEPYYYRPLIVLFWAAECFMWGINGFYFRICSILIMLLSSLILGLIVLDLTKNNNRSSLELKTKITWAFSSAALFAIYPLHISAVNWFAAQHTLLVSLFYLLSFWCYLSWRNSSLKSFFISSSCFFVLALLTEEMAATLPFILVAYELLCVDHISASIKWLKTLYKILQITLPYWSLLAIYFCLRQLVLGTFTTKFSGFYHQRSADMFQLWLHGIQKILLPIDFYSIAKNSPVSILWQVIIFLLLVLSLYAFIAANSVPKHKRLVGFLIIWFFVSLAPSNNIFVFDVPYLLNTRVAYLATVPLCIFLTYGIARFSSGFKYSALINTIGGALFVLSTLILYCNNYAFSHFGQETNNIIDELQRYYRATPGDPQVKILGLPMLHTSHISCMLKRPFLERDIVNCNSLRTDDQSVPFGALRGPRNTNEWKMNFLYWDNKKQQLNPTMPYSALPACINFPVNDYKKSWQGKELKALIRKEISSPAIISWEGANIVHLTSKERSSLDINLAGLPCWPIDFVCFKVKINAQESKGAQRTYELRFSDDITQIELSGEYPPENNSSVIKIIPTGKEQDLIFPLRGLPNWALGGTCGELKLFLPPNTDMRLISMTLPETNTIIPMTNETALIKLSQFCNQQLIHYDASHIKNCTHAVLEIVGPNKDFETLYSYKQSPSVILNIPTSTPCGTLTIAHALFPLKGSYKGRLRALDDKKEQVGLCGDHFLVNID